MESDVFQFACINIAQHWLEHRSSVTEHMAKCFTTAVTDGLLLTEIKGESPAS